MFQRIKAAHETCLKRLKSMQVCIPQAEPPETYPPNVPTLPSDPPSQESCEDVVLWAVEFLQKLGAKSSTHHREKRQLLADIQQFATNPWIDQLLEFALRCIQKLADHQQEQCASGIRSWRDCGFKQLSFEGYDVINNLRAVDYGNEVYLAHLQFCCLQKPKIWNSLNSMREAWPVYLDLWRHNKTQRHVERLADIVEIVMGALRGVEWFKPSRDQCLPLLFNLHVNSCRLVQHLDA